METNKQTKKNPKLNLVPNCAFILKSLNWMPLFDREQLNSGGSASESCFSERFPKCS